MRRTLGWKPAWTARVLARVQGTGDRFAADEILTILSAGEAGFKVDDVCAAADIPIETYYTWKAKYRGLTPAKVRDLRRREQRIRRATVVSVAALVVAAIGAPCAFLVARGTRASASVPSSVAAPVAPPAPIPTAPVSAPDQSAGQVIDQEQPVPVAPEVNTNGAAGADRGDGVDGMDASRSPGFAVQIAALPDLQEARRTLAQLKAAGYPAFLSPTTVGQVSLYRVRIGPMKTRALAEDVAGRLQHDGYPPPWITK